MADALSRKRSKSYFPIDYRCLHQRIELKDMIFSYLEKPPKTNDKLGKNMYHEMPVTNGKISTERENKIQFESMDSKEKFDINVGKLVESDSMDACFTAFDKNGDGYLDIKEFNSLCRALFRNDRGKIYALDSQQLRDIFDVFDRNLDGYIDRNEFVMCWNNWIKTIVRPVNAFLIVDVQNDFISGSLNISKCAAQQNGLDVIEPINRLLDTIDFDVVFYSFDWHPTDHVSFIDNLPNRKLHSSSPVTADKAQLYDTVTFEGPPMMKQRLWPRHCVQDSWGAELHKDLKVVDGAIKIYKGTNPEVDSYSVFWDNKKLERTTLDDQLQAKNATDIYVCGLAYDVCVGATAVDALANGYRVILIDDCCRGVDIRDIEKTKNTVMMNNGVIVDSSKVKAMVEGRDRRPELGYKLAMELKDAMKNDFNMYPSKAFTMSDNTLVEPEQDANSALTELDKGLRSGKVGEQCEAIVKFPRLFEKYPFPILINSSLLKLADVFRVGNNFLRVWVLRVCQQSEKHLDKILSVDEFVRRIFSVMHSNDPIARALTLRTLGAVAGIIPERQQVHHGIRRSLDSHDAVEVEAAVYAATQFAAQSKKFAVSMCNKVSEMIQGLATPAHRKLQLIPILQHMHHDISTASMVRVLCTQLLTSYPAQDFVIVTLSALTELTAATLVDIPQQVKLLVGYLRNDQRWEIKGVALKGLHKLASEGAHLWPQDSVEDIVKVALNTDKNRLLSAALDVLLVLSKTALTCHNQYDPNSLVVTLCKRCYSAGNTIIAAKAIQIVTSILCYCCEENLPMENVNDLVDAIDSLFLLVTCEETNKKLYELKACLKCAVKLCKVCPALSHQFVEIIATRLFLSDSCNSLLCEALGAIGGLQPSALNNILTDIINKLNRLSEFPDLSTDQIHTKVILCTLLFQSQVGYKWNPELKEAVRLAAKGNHYWSNYRIARSACRYGHHEISHDIFSVLKDRVSSVHYHFWLTSLEELSKGESVLLSQQDLIAKLSSSLTHYNKALSSLRAASTPSQNLGFQAEYVKVRCEFLQCLLQLVHAGHALCAAPPPAIAAAIVASTRDELQRYGHVTQQLRKCVKEFRACGEMYQKLYQSAFDADPESLKNIQVYQQMCFLMSSNIEKVCQLNPQEEFVLDFCSQETSLEIQYLTQCCRQSISLVEPILSNKEVKPITHQHINGLIQLVKVLAETSLCIPRYFFQTLQSTSVKLNISPQPRVVGESVSVQGGSHLAVKVEGVLVHDARPGIFRKAAEIVITLVSQLQARQHNQTDSKVTDVGSVVTQTVTPHKDFFTAQFLLAFATGGQYSLSVEAAIADENGHVWKTGPKVTLAVKSHEENSKGNNVQNATRPFTGPRF